MPCVSLRSIQICGVCGLKCCVTAVTALSASLLHLMVRPGNKQTRECAARPLVNQGHGRGCTILSGPFHLGPWDVCHIYLVEILIPGDTEITAVKVRPAQSNKSVM